LNTRQSIGLLAIVYLLIIIFCNYSLGLYSFTDSTMFEKYDTVSYLESTQRLISHFQPHPYRCIGYSLFLAIPYALFSSSNLLFICVHTIQLMMLFTIYVIVYVLLKKYVSNKLALVMIIGFMLNISYIGYAYLVLTEIPFLLLITLSVFYFHHYLQYNKVQHLFIGFTFLCFSILFKPGFYLFGLLIFISICLLFFVRNASFKNLLILFIIMLSTIGFQKIWMNSSYNTFKLSYIDDITKYRYLNSSIIAFKNNLELTPLMQQRDQAMLVNFNNFKTADNLNTFHLSVKAESSFLLKQYPLASLYAFTDNIYSNYHSGNAIIRDIEVPNLNNETARKAFFNYTRIWNMLMGAILIISTVYFLIIIRKLYRIHQARFFFIVLLFSYCYYNILISGASFYQGDRFNVVWMPFVLIILSLLGSKKLLKVT
jgi:hypothetical protein